MSDFHVSTQETLSLAVPAPGPHSYAIMPLFFCKAPFVLQPTFLSTDFIGRPDIILLLNCIPKAYWYLGHILTCGGKERKASVPPYTAVHLAPANLL